MIRAAAVLLVAAAAGCRSVPPYKAPKGPPEAVYAALVADGQEGIAREDEALWRCETASAALMVGEEDAAFKALDGASRIMGTLQSTSAENARAILGAESTKVWKGDPYERCMNALYKGLLYWRRGDLGNAAACFKSGLLADAYSEAGEHQRDFAALSFLLGWVSHRRGQYEQARFSFREAAEFAPDNPYFADPRPDEDNVLVVADIGKGPLKFADGPGGSIARFMARPYEESGIEIRVDGVLQGKSEPATDLLIQAVTRGERVLDGIRGGKAVFQAGTHVAGAVVLSEGARRDKWELAAVGAGLLVLSALTNPRADTRHWSQLPREVQILPLRIEPGRHELTVQVLDKTGLPIRGWARTFEVSVPPSGDRLYYFRPYEGGGVAGLTDPPPGP